jgi:c-di-GMP-binding flagellar brake protein YcgR
MRDNTREHQRYDVRISAEVSLQEGDSITCVTKDLSLGGVGIETEWAFPDKVIVSVELFVVVDDIEDEATTPLAIRGQIVWTRKRGERDYLAGIQFLELTEEQKTYLNQLVTATVTAAAS